MNLTQTKQKKKKTKVEFLKLTTEQSNNGINREQKISNQYPQNLKNMLFLLYQKG